METDVQQNVSLDRFVTSMSAAFAALATLLAAIGLYGVLAYTVTQRTREFGLRMALGAQRYEVMRMVSGEGLLLTASGITLGMAGAAGLTRYLRGMLCGLTALALPAFATAAPAS